MSYQILGRAVKSEYLALGTFVGIFGLATSLSGGKKEETKPVAAGKNLIERVKEAVPLNAGSSEEEQFIRNFIAEAEKAETKH